MPIGELISKQMIERIAAQGPQDLAGPVQLGSVAGGIQGRAGGCDLRRTTLGMMIDRAAHRRQSPPGSTFMLSDTPITRIIMPERIMPGLGLRAFYDPGQRNWGTSLSEDLRALSVLVQARALSRLAPLPGSGSTGDIRIVPADAPAHANTLALWDGEPGTEEWLLLTPQEGWQVWVTDEARHVRFTGGTWVEVPRPGVVAIRTLTATAHTLEAIDQGSILETTGSSAVTVTIPDEATVPFEIGTLVNVTQVGAGVASVAAAAGVSLNGVTGGAVALDGQWSGAALVKRGADAWVIQGALAGAVA